MRNDSGARSTAANAVWNTLGTLSGIALSFVTAPLLIHGLGESKYGIYLLIGSFLGILSVMRFGVGEATLRYVAQFQARGDAVAVNRVFGATLSFYVLVALMATTAVMISAPSLVSWLSISALEKELAQTLVRIAVVTFAVGIVSMAYTVIPAALQRFDISMKLSVSIMVARMIGYVAIVLLGFDLIGLVVWDLVLSIVSFGIWVWVARRMLPGLRLWPNFDFSGLRETIAYSVFSFLTWAFHTAHRESGKLLIGRLMGAAPVGYLGAPDGIAQRLHAIIASTSEVMLPRFSADSDSKDSEKLFWVAVWAGFAIASVLFVPFIVLVPDFLSLWISPTFAQRSGLIGQLLGVYLIFQSGFTPVAAFYRGSGRPGFVTLVILGSLVITVIAALRLVPELGAVGAAYAYLAGSLSPLIGTLVGVLCAFRSPSALKIVRVVLLPLAAGGAALCIDLWLRSLHGPVGWIGLAGYGTVCLGVAAALVFGSDLLFGGSNAASKVLVARIWPRGSGLFTLRAR